MMSPAHDRVRELLGEYVLGQLTPAERRDVERHVAGCAGCTEELRELTLVVEGLARAPEAVELPPGLKARVMRELAPPVLGSRFSVRVLVAAAALIVVLGGFLFVSIQRERRMVDRIIVSESESRELRDRLRDVSDQADLALAILTATDMRRADLSAGAGGTGATTARAYWSPTRGLLLVADQLPQPPAGRVYQVWLIGGGAKPVSAGLIGDRSPGRGMLIVPPPNSAPSGAVTVAITDEPPGGLAAPSGSIRLVGSI